MFFPRDEHCGSHLDIFIGFNSGNSGEIANHKPNVCRNNFATDDVRVFRFAFEYIQRFVDSLVFHVYLFSKLATRNNILVFRHDVVHAPVYRLPGRAEYLRNPKL